MTPGDFESALARDRDLVEARLRAIVEERASHHAGIAEAIRYALLGGGKRLRPLLCLWTHDVFAGPARARTRATALDAACAVECVHAYSLAHDDLPCMDDDDLRRGKPSLHRRFDEATAVLTGDALLTLAFDVLANLDAAPAVALDAVRVLASAAGTGGLVTGQALDLEHTGRDDDRALALVERIHEFKTARLFAAALEIGAVAAWDGRVPDGDARERVRRAGHQAGSAFQIVDDLLDIEGDAATLGKTPRKDVARGKLTFPAVAGRGAAGQAAHDRIASALGTLPEAGGTPLASLIALVETRRS
ncbi:MAG TPA: polyprenyl synthetase family protein [Candidatus Krumholzibacteria bacterium]|nr:polyprenyl synthetase family protein [Candidatus Krumholzibacteria bacterium]